MIKDKITIQYKYPNIIDLISLNTENYHLKSPSKQERQLQCLKQLFIGESVAYVN